MALPVVAVVGRPNVGKSTLVNRIVALREAIVHEEPGVTRDRNYLETEWRGRSFVLVDTGGFTLGRTSELDKEVTRQALVAVEEAEVIVFLVDGPVGLFPADEEIADILRKSQKPMVLAVNKVDSEAQAEQLSSFYRLGFGELVSISALHGLGIGELLDEVVALLPDVADARVLQEDTVSVAIVGRPNSGKSSVLNQLLGEERAVVSDLAGTTRDATGTLLDVDGRSYYFVDTAGLRRESRIKKPVEYYGLIRTLKALDEADVALVVLDAALGITEQDQKIATFVRERSCAAVLILNKKDLLKGPESRQKLHHQLQRKMAFMSYAPLLEVSAWTGAGMEAIFSSIEAVDKEYRRRISTSKLNWLWQELRAEGAQFAKSGRALKLSYLTQVSVAPPHFVFFVNDPKLVSGPERRYFENQLRRAFGFEGAPLRLTFRSKRRAKKKAG